MTSPDETVTNGLSRPQGTQGRLSAADVHDDEGIEAGGGPRARASAPTTGWASAQKMQREDG